MDDSIEADVLAMGSSRIVKHFDPAVFDSVAGVKSYNIGMDGAHIPDILARYILYKQRNPLPKVALVNIDYFTLTDNSTKDMSLCFLKLEEKNGKRTEYTCQGADWDLPLVVLVNQYSASASEILSGAIKDAGIGKLVGKKTYGKGIVQSVIGLGDGSAVKLTIANYYTRNGNDIHLKGIEPDVEVELDSDAYLEDKTDTQLDKAIEVLKEEMK